MLRSSQWSEIGFQLLLYSVSDFNHKFIQLKIYVSEWKKCWHQQIQIKFIWNEAESFIYDLMQLKKKKITGTGQIIFLYSLIKKNLCQMTTMQSAIRPNVLWVYKICEYWFNSEFYCVCSVHLSFSFVNLFTFKMCN